jgi:hypothetical protein
MSVISAPFDPPDLRELKVGTEYADHHGFAMVFRRGQPTEHRCSCGGDISDLMWKLTTDVRKGLSG